MVKSKNTISLECNVFVHLSQRNSVSLSQVLSSLLFCFCINKVETMIKELKEALRFVLSVEFWRIAVLWTISLLTSYFQLHSRRLFSRKAQSYPRCHPPISESLRPVCVITGVSHLYFHPIFSLWPGLLLICSNFMPFFVSLCRCCRLHQDWELLLHTLFHGKVSMLFLVLCSAHNLFHLLCFCPSIGCIS